MDAIALLNALDVIRNEKVYQERLNNLAEAKAKLDTSQYIVETVEIAQARLDEANRLLAQYKKQLVDAKQEIEDLRSERLHDVVIREDNVKESERRLQEQREEITRQEIKLKFQFEEFKKQQQALAQRNKDYDDMVKETSKVKETYQQKIEQLRKIIGV